MNTITACPRCGLPVEIGVAGHVYCPDPICAWFEGLDPSPNGEHQPEGLSSLDSLSSPPVVDPRRRTNWTAAELLRTEFPEPRFAVEGLIPEGLAFFAGAPKLGKSWLALALSIAVAGGGNALGKIAVESGPALYLALEDSPRRLKARLRTLLDGDAAPADLFIETEWPRLDEGGGERLEEWLRAHPDARIVLVDVWPRIRPRVKKSGDYFQADYDGAALLQRVATEHGVAVVALFHTRKAEAEDFVQTVQGTFGTAAAADTILVVKRSRGRADATLHVTGRDIEERELALTFEPAAGTWSLLGDAAEFTIGETRRELLEALKAHASLTPKEASEVTTISHDLAKRTLARMRADGQIEGKHGRYTLLTPVPAVPMSPDRDKETPGTLVLREPSGAT